MASSDSLEADLDAIAAPQAASSGNSLEDDLNAISSSAQQGQPQNLDQKIGHYVGLVNRGIMQGAGAIPSMVGDPLVAGYNALATHIGLPQSPTNVSGLINKGATALGMAEPQSLPESLLTGATSAAVSMKIPIPLLDSLKPGTSQTLLNNSWAQAIGEDADKLKSSVLNSAYSRMGEVFDSVRDQTPRPLNTQNISTAVNGIDDEFKGMLTDANANISDHPLVQKFLNFATDNPSSATGEQLGKLSSQLGKVSTKQFISGDPDLGAGLSQVKELVDDAVQQGLTPEQSQEYGIARSQYRAMSQMLRSRALNVDTGDINANTMGSFLQNTDRQGYALGNNTAPHYEMTRAMRGQNAGPLGALQKFHLAGIPSGPIAAGIYKKGWVPPVVKGAAGAYEGISEPNNDQP